ncbi:M56 family metallopeptidase [Paenibacillus tyrfis]|uniref:M56 family metallopeptidase n=1 Tax=Paenibacillus tyrfis TaxID=1501230 RepID=UPI00209D8E8E|nr:M56 family metallopeptidase [Paenibacillus tyrfis]MCP1306897.1 M56 family metallopeptidase [Paenibacillus tyrfis]
MSFFDWILETSLMAAVLVGLVLLVKVIARNKLSPRWHYMLWLVIVARLLLPWAPESSFSVYNLLSYGQEALRTSDAPSPRPPEASPIVHQEMPNTAAVKTAPAEDKQGPPVQMADPVEKQPSASFSIYKLVFGVWLLGAVCLGILTVAANRRVYARLAKQPVITDLRITGLFEQCRKTMSIRQSIPLITAGPISSPAVFGFMRPRIVLSDSLMNMLDDRQLRFIFFHELAHVKRKDVAMNWLMNGLLILHWFNPVLWYAYYRMREDQEMAADALALSYIGAEQKESYGHTIIRLLEHYVTLYPTPGMANLSGGKQQIKRRIIMIKNYHKKSYRWSALGLASVIALSSVTLVNAKASPESASGNLSAPPVIVTESSGSSEAKKKLTIHDIPLDKNVVEAAQEELRRFLGDSKAELYEVADPGITAEWILLNKNGKGQVAIDRNTKQIVNAYVQYTWGETNAAVKEAAAEAFRQVDANKTFTAETVEREKRFEDGKSTHEWRLQSKEMIVTLDADTLSERGILISYPFAQGDEKAKNAAQNAFQRMNIGNPVAFKQADHNYSSGRYDSWKFFDDGGNYVVVIGAKTGAIQSISAYGKKEDNEANLPLLLNKDRKPIYTKEEAVAAAKPMVNKLFGIDLTGYTVEFVPENPYAHIFTKAGQPTVNALVDRTGEFWSYSVDPVDGTMND